VSAEDRGSKRRERDHYPTPFWVAKAILPQLPRAGLWLDPAAGEGNLLEVLQRTGRKACGIELDPERHLAARQSGFECDCLDALECDWGMPDVVFMNPPYSLAQEFVEKAIAEVVPGGTVAALLGLGFLASEKRTEFHRRYPCDVYVLNRRPSFTGDGGTDRVDAFWGLWGPGRGGRWSRLDVAKEEAL
jgi:hypothetical protein